MSASIDAKNKHSFALHFNSFIFNEKQASYNS